jgi:3-phenylpropionate/cinnamic acid dioxygenase small subunit
VSEASSRLAAADVIIQYAACIDDRDFNGYRACFAPDVELVGFGPDPILGVDAWVKFVRKALEPYAATQHMLGPPRIELRGDDRAELRTDLQAQHFLREPRGQIFSLWGTYRTSLARAEGRWAIVRHELQVRSVRTS